MTLAELLDVVRALRPELTAPSISYGARQLYARGIFEEETRDNLGRTLAELLRSEGGVDVASALLVVNDKQLSNPLRLRIAIIQPS